MTLWLTLLLVWTTGIPAALFLTASLAATMHDRRAGRLPRLPIPRHVHPAGQACGRRVHGYGRLALTSAQPVRARVGVRRR
jgi:hypothetical protein